MGKIIIGIHGLANKPPAETLAGWWKAAISEGLEKNCGIANPGFEFRMVYWADRLYKNPMHQEKGFEFDKLYNDEPYAPAADGELKRHDDNWKDGLAAFSRGTVGWSVDKLKEYFGMDALADRVLGKTLKDLDFYYDPGRQIPDRSGTLGTARQVLRGILNQALREEKAKEMMVIAHSMGSIVAYDVLRDLGMPGADSGVAVQDFVTIGAPLGLPHVLHKIKEERTYDDRVRTPSVVRGSWVNYADRRDPVCADIHLADDFAANDAGVTVRDDIVLNTYHKPGDEKAANHHKSYGYLRTPEFSDQVGKFLGIG